MVKRSKAKSFFIFYYGKQVSYFIRITEFYYHYQSSKNIYSVKSTFILMKSFKKLNPVSIVLFIIVLIGILLMILAYLGVTPK